MTTTNHITNVDFGKNMPSFMRSTLSITYILIVISILAVFIYISISQGQVEMITFGVLMTIVGGYGFSRIPSLPDNQQRDDPVEKAKVSDTARGVGE